MLLKVFLFDLYDKESVLCLPWLLLAGPALLLGTTHDVFQPLYHVDLLRQDKAIRW